MICHLVIYVFSLKTDCELTHFYGTFKKKKIWQMSMVKKYVLCIFVKEMFSTHNKNNMADVYGKKNPFLCIFVNEIFSTRKKKIFGRCLWSKNICFCVYLSKKGFLHMIGLSTVF